MITFFRQRKWLSLALVILVAAVMSLTPALAMARGGGGGGGGMGGGGGGMGGGGGGGVIDPPPGAAFQRIFHII